MKRAEPNYLSELIVIKSTSVQDAIAPFPRSWGYKSFATQLQERAVVLNDRSGSDGRRL